jgi:hypothetical protein
MLASRGSPTRRGYAIASLLVAAMRDIADEPDWEEITTVEEFRERVSGRFGVIVIEDTAREQAIFHDRACPFVGEGFFREKVIVGAGSTGRYFWAKNSNIAKRELSARPCQHAGDKFAGR